MNLLDCVPESLKYTPRDLTHWWILVVSLVAEARNNMILSLEWHLDYTFLGI